MSQSDQDLISKPSSDSSVQSNISDDSITDRTSDQSGSDDTDSLSFQLPEITKRKVILLLSGSAEAEFVYCQHVVGAYLRAFKENNGAQVIICATPSVCKQCHKLLQGGLKFATLMDVDYDWRTALLSGEENSKENFLALVNYISEQDIDSFSIFYINESDEENINFENGDILSYDDFVTAVRKIALRIPRLLLWLSCCNSYLFYQKMIPSIQNLVLITSTSVGFPLSVRNHSESQNEKSIRVCNLF